MGQQGRMDVNEIIGEIRKHLTETRDVIAEVESLLCTIGTDAEVPLLPLAQPLLYLASLPHQIEREASDRLRSLQPRQGP